MFVNSVCGQECLSIVCVVKNVCQWCVWSRIFVNSVCGQECLSIVCVVKNVYQ